MTRCPLFAVRNPRTGKFLACTLSADRRISLDAMRIFLCGEGIEDLTEENLARLGWVCRPVNIVEDAEDEDA